MPLQPTNIPLVFRGLDTKVDPRHQVVGDLTLLQNVRLDAYPKLLKRFGVAPLATAAAGASLSSYKNQLLLGDGKEAQSFAAGAGPGAGALVDKGVLESMTLSVQAAHRDAYTQTTPDMAIHPSGITVYTWETSAGGAQYAVYDSSTGQPRVPAVTLSATASRPKPFALGNYVVVVYFDSATGHIRRIAIPVVSPSTPLAATDLAIDPQTSPPVFDATIIAGTLYLAYATNGGTIALTSLSPTLASGAEAQVITATPSVVSIFGDASGDLWVAYYASPTLKVAVFGSTFATVLAPTTVDASPGTVLNITGIAPVTTATLYYEVSAAATYDHFVKTATVTLLGAVSGVAVYVRSVGLAGKPFFYLGRVHVLATYQSSLQSTYFLLSGAVATVVGKIAYGTGGGLTAHASVLPEVTSGGAGIYSIAYLQAFELSSIGGNIFTQAGVQAVTFDFTQPQTGLELSDDLHLTGGILSMYDGTQVAEHGFNLYPENLTFTAGGSGSITGQYQACAVYEWMDGQGLLHQSAPSPVVTITASSAAYFDYTVSSLRLTSKTTPIAVVFYRTAANAAGVFYRVSSIANPNLNSTTVDTISAPLHGDTAVDATLIGNAQLYSPPGVQTAEVPNIAASSPSFIWKYRTRAFMVPAEQPFQVQFSKSFVPGVPIEWNPQQFFLSVAQDAGPLVCGMEMDDKNVLFSTRGIYVMSGDGPTPNDLNSDYGVSPQRLPTDVGCANRRSLVLTPAGILFQSAKGIYLLDRGLGLHYVGDKVEAFNDQTVTGARVEPNSRRVVFYMSGGIALAFDYTGLVVSEGQMVGRGIWAVWTNQNAADATVFQGMLTYVKPNGRLLQSTPGLFTDDGQPVNISLTTSILSFAGISGFQRVWRLIVKGDYRSPHNLTVSIATDDCSAPAQNETADTGSILDPGANYDDQVFSSEDPESHQYPAYEWQVRLREQKTTSVQITLTESQLPTYGEGLSLSGITFQVGVKEGLHKVPARRTISSLATPFVPSRLFLSPTVGSIAGGTTVQVNGLNFMPGATVTFDGLAATIVSITPTLIVVTTPAHAAGAVDVVVTNPGAPPATLENGFTFQAIPLGFWTLFSMPGGPDTVWHDVVRAAGIGFVAVGEDDSGLGIAAVSTDSGETWNSATVPGGIGPLRGVAFDGTTLVAVGRNAALSSAISLTSTTGLAWVSHTMAGGDLAHSVAFGAGVFAATTTNAGYIQTAADGATWTARSGAGSGQRTKIIRVSGLSLFVARGSGSSPGAINTSANGTSGWTDQTTPGFVDGVLATDGANILAFNNDGSFTALSSTDGAAYVTQQSVGDQPRSAIWDIAGSRWVVVTNSTTVTAATLASSWATVETSTRRFEAIATDGVTLVAVGGYDDDGNPAAGIH